MKQKRFSSEQQQALLHQWRVSGLPGEQFARERGVSLASLKRWRKTWSATTQQPVFRAVKVRTHVNPTPADIDTPVAELMAGGLTVRLLRGVQRDDVAMLVTVLREVVAC